MVYLLKCLQKNFEKQKKMISERIFLYSRIQININISTHRSQVPSSRVGWFWPITHEHFPEFSSKWIWLAKTEYQILKSFLPQLNKRRKHEKCFSHNCKNKIMSCYKFLIIYRWINSAPSLAKVTKIVKLEEVKRPRSHFSVSLKTQRNLYGRYIMTLVQSDHYLYTA